MKLEELSSYLGKSVKVTLHDGFISIGILEQTYGSNNNKIPHYAVNSFTTYQIIDGYKVCKGVYKSSSVKKVEEMDTVIIKCPKCGSKKITVEKRLFGNAECLDCKYYGKYVEFQEKLTKGGKEE